MADERKALPGGPTRSAPVWGPLNGFMGCVALSGAAAAGIGWTVYNYTQSEALAAALATGVGLTGMLGCLSNVGEGASRRYRTGALDMPAPEAMPVQHGAADLGALRPDAAGAHALPLSLPGRIA